MKGDYLWDGSGEPDPDVQKLERALGKLRHSGRAPALPVMPAQRRRLPLNWLAVAAALVVAVMAGWWVVAHKQNRAESPAPQITRSNPAALPEIKPDSKDEKRQVEQAPLTILKDEKPVIARAERKARRDERPRVETPEGTSETVQHDAIAIDAEIDDITALSTVAMTGMDSEITRHIEKAQMLLRSFRNVEPNQRRVIDVSYERKLSRELLYQNIVLRRDAQAKGEEPVAQLLDSLEPYLIDIANLPGKASREDLASIKDRMQKKEIVATLQVYSLQASNPIY